MLKELKTKLKNAAITAGKVTIILASMAIGFGISQLYTFYSKDSKPEQAAQIGFGVGLSKTSIAINERSELMIIDRETGKYTVYSDSVGRSIFNLYASQFYAKANQ